MANPKDKAPYTPYEAHGKGGSKNPSRAGVPPAPECTMDRKKDPRCIPKASAKTKKVGTKAKAPDVTMELPNEAMEIHGAKAAAKKAPPTVTVAMGVVVSKVPPTVVAMSVPLAKPLVYTRPAPDAGSVIDVGRTARCLDCVKSYQS